MAVPQTRPLYAWERTPPPRPVIEAAPEPDPSTLERLAAREIWRVAPSRKPAGGTLEPLSPEWFRHLEDKRYRRHGRWVPSLLEFNRHANESIVAVGDGLGFDWVKYAEAGANVAVIEPSSERQRLYRAHFAARDVSVQCLHASFEHWPMSDARTDVVTAVFHDRPPAWHRIVTEAYRVLRPGGKFLAVVPSHFNATRWQQILLPWRSLFARRSNVERERFSGRELRAECAAFAQVSVHKRHLRRSELPYVWRWMLLPVSERLMGRFLVVKAFKPLTSAIALRVAA